MSFSKVEVLEKVNDSQLIQIGILSASALIAPIFSNQLITGSIVNATLFIAASTLSPNAALLICLLPSLIALGVGTLPAPLAPLLPGIMLSNVLLATSFIAANKLNYWPRMIISSLIKFLFLFAFSSLFTNIVSSGLIVMMSWPQLITALMGGILAYGTLKFIKK